MKTGVGGEEGPDWDLPFRLPLFRGSNIALGKCAASEIVAFFGSQMSVSFTIVVILEIVFMFVLMAQRAD